MARKPKDPKSVAPADVAAVIATAAEQMPTPSPARRGGKRHQAPAAAAAALRASASPARKQRARKADPEMTAEPESDVDRVNALDDVLETTSVDEAAGKHDADEGAGTIAADAGGRMEEIGSRSPDLVDGIPGKPAAEWDQASDSVRFDWPEIERTAAQGGPNQVMAKLLLAACAEGAKSRWPLAV